MESEKNEFKNKDIIESIDLVFDKENEEIQEVSNIINYKPLEFRVIQTHSLKLEIPSMSEWVNLSLNY